MTNLKQRRRAHSINRRCGAQVKAPKVIPRRDIAEAFNHWVANKRVVIGTNDLELDGLSILNKEPLVLDVTEEGLLVMRPQQECDLSAPFALVSRQPSQEWVRVSLDPR